MLALISDRPVVAKILRHLGLPAERPTIAPAPARREVDADLAARLPDLDEAVDLVVDEANRPAGELARRDHPDPDDEAPP